MISNQGKDIDDINVEEVRAIAERFAMLAEELCEKFDAQSVMIGSMAYAEGSVIAMIETGVSKEYIKELRQRIHDLTVEMRNSKRFEA